MDNYQNISYMVYDLINDHIITAQNPTKIAPVASIVKLIVAMQVLDQQPNLSEHILVDGTAPGGTEEYGPLPMGLVTREDLLKAALIQSDNHAVYYLCQAYPGGEDKMLQDINDRVQKLNMNNTEIVFLHTSAAKKIPGKFNASTAEDLQKLLKEVLKYPIIKEISTTKKATVFDGRIQLENKSRIILEKNNSVILNKTGRGNGGTSYSIAIAINKNNKLYGIVVLDAKDGSSRAQIVFNLMDRYTI